ncbi:MAG: hypothetical protein HC938_14125 [Nitrospira sp.]|nr:hypothetical protein [Nitrospira sp.]
MSIFSSFRGVYPSAIADSACPVYCPCPQRRPATLRRQKNYCCTPKNLLFDNPSAVDPTSSQPGDGDLFVISGLGVERDRGQCLFGQARLVVAAGYRRCC